MKVGTLKVCDLFGWMEPQTWHKLANTLGTTDEAIEQHARHVICKRTLTIVNTVQGRVKDSPYKTIPQRSDSLVTIMVHFPFGGKIHLLQLELECLGYRRFECRLVAKKGEVR